MIEGFLVALAEHPNDSINAPYRGIDRMVPFNQERWDGGFDHPTMSWEFVDENLLFRSLALAREAVRRYQAAGTGALEVLYVTGIEPGDSLPSGTTRGGITLGFDVAGPAPFYSVVGDMPPGLRAAWLPQLNKYGLLADLDDAQAFRDVYQASQNRDQRLLIWRVAMVPSEDADGVPE